MKLSEAMRERMLLSFELFPPKTEKGMDNLPGTIDHLMKYKPAYISCTYGAGGGNVGANREVCQMIKKAGTAPVTHFTVIKNTKEGIKEQLDQYLAEGVDHMLALRGDIPLGETTTCGDFNYATDLVKFVRDEFGDKFEIAVAGSPEGHIAAAGVAVAIGLGIIMFSKHNPGMSNKPPVTWTDIDEGLEVFEKVGRDPSKAAEYLLDQFYGKGKWTHDYKYGFNALRKWFDRIIRNWPRKG